MIWVIIVAWPILALLFALAMGKAIAIADRRDRESAERAKGER